MATIKVNSTVMREKASTLKAISSSVSSITTDALTEINSLRSYWEGSAAENYVTSFKALSSKFEEISKTIKEYATFLDNAAYIYEKNENANS